MIVTATVDLERRDSSQLQRSEFCALVNLFQAGTEILSFLRVPPSYIVAIYCGISARSVPFAVDSYQFSSMGYLSACS